MSDDYERLIVLLEGRIDQFDKAMKAAEKRGTATYQALQTSATKATTTMQARINQMAQSQGRALDQVAGKTEAAAERSAKSYAAWWREMERGRDALNQLRASVDSTFAQQLRYDAAVDQLNDALRRNIITEVEHRQILDQVSAAYLRGGQAAGAHTGVMGSLGAMSDATKSKLQNAGYQVQDVAVQIMAGTDAMRAMSMQIPQLLGGFGLLGVVLGTLASIGLPLLSSMLGTSEGAAKGFDDALGEVRNSLSAMNEQAAIYTAEGLMALKEKYGEVNLELLRFVNLQTEIMQRDALKATSEALDALKAKLEGGFWGTGDVKYELQEMFSLALPEANKLYAAMRKIDEARTFEDQLAAVTQLKQGIVAATGGVGNMTDEQYEFFKTVQASEDALRQMVATVPKQGWLEAAIGQAETLADKLWNAVSAKLALAEEAAKPGMDTGNLDWAKNDIGFVRPGSELIYTPPKTKGGGGGGGGRSERAGKIDALVEDLKTEREMITLWYEESLALLNGATETELAVVGGKHEALERLEAEHQERLKGIRDGGNTRNLEEQAKFWGSMAALTAAGGDKTNKATRVFGAIEAFLNTKRAQAQVLADPKLGFWGKMAAYGAIGAAGLGVVQAIKGGGGGGGGGGGASASSGSAPADSATGAEKGPLRVMMERLDPTALYSGAVVGKLLDKLMEEAGDRGAIFVKGAGA